MQEDAVGDDKSECSVGQPTLSKTDLSHPERNGKEEDERREHAGIIAGPHKGSEMRERIDENHAID